LSWHDATGGLLTLEDWIALDRYVAGEGSAEEREAMRLRIQANPRLAAIVEVMRSSHRGPAEAPVGAPSTAAAWEAVSARLRFDSPTERERRRAPLALIATPQRRESRVWRLAGIAAATFIVAGTTVGAWRFLQRTRDARLEAPAIRAAYQTARGERATIELRDGTSVTLAPETKLSIASTDRQVYLSGEAVFTVTHDPANPFRVIANGAEIRDIGTRFDVRAYPVEHIVRVVVADGSVSLLGGAQRLSNQPVVLPRGALAIIDSAGAARITQSVTADRYLSWAQGQLTFTDTRMADVVVEMSRWFNIDVRLGDGTLSDVRLTVALNDAPADVAVGVIARAIDARVVRTGQSATLYPRNSGRRQ
jgi:transmembrane sensor